MHFAISGCWIDRISVAGMSVIQGVSCGGRDVAFLFCGRMVCAICPVFAEWSRLPFPFRSSKNKYECQNIYFIINSFYLYFAGGLGILFY